VLYDSTAIGWTEAPDSLRGLLKQRFRWTYGTLQCLWKHRHVTLKPRYKALGLIAVPQTWLFLFLFSIVAPLVDLTLVWRLAASTLDYVHHYDQFDGDTLRRVCLYYLVFLLARRRCPRLGDGGQGKLEPHPVARAAAPGIPATHVLHRHQRYGDGGLWTSGRLGQA